MPRRSLLASEGICDWKYFSEKRTQHEESKEHLINLRTIDRELQELITNDTQYWKQVMSVVVKCLAVHKIGISCVKRKT